MDNKIPKEIKTEEIDQLLLKAIEQLIPQHPRYDRLATRQLLKQINKRIDQKLGGFREYLDHAISQDLVIEEVRDFDLELLESRSEERRVGKECRGWWRTGDDRKKMRVMEAKVRGSEV